MGLVKFICNGLLGGQPYFFVFFWFDGYGQINDI